MGLASRSYVEGFVPSQLDVTTFTALPCAPDAQYAHVARWYRHIKSYTPDEHKSFAVVEASEAPKAAAEAKDSDDDFDMFDDDSDEEEETEEEKRIMEELVREIKCDGLIWGQSKLVPLAYGINTLSIS